VRPRGRMEGGEGSEWVGDDGEALRIGDDEQVVREVELGDGLEKDWDSDAEDAAEAMEEGGDAGGGEGEEGGEGGEEGGEEGGAARFAPSRDDALCVLSGHGGEPVYSVAISPVDATVVATGGGDDRCLLWRVGGPDAAARAGAPLQPYAALEGHRESISAVAFSADGAMVATGDLEGEVCVWEVARGTKAVGLEGPCEAIEFVAWHPRGPVVLCGSEDCTSWMWSVPDGTCMQVFSGHSARVTCGGFTADGKAVVTGSEDASLRVWNPKTGACVWAMEDAHSFHREGLTGLRCHPTDPNVVMTAGDDKTACVVNLASMRVLAKFEGAHRDAVEAAGLCDAAPLAATCSMDGEVRVWELGAGGGKLRAALAHGGHGVVTFRWIPGQPLLVSAGGDGCLRLWDARNGSLVGGAERQGHTDTILDLALSADGTVAVTGSEDGTARVWRLV